MRKQGFSLIEVVVFVTILGLFFVVAAAVSSAAIRNMKISEHKMLATYYADELMEWLRYQKMSNWQTFSSYASQTGTAYCFSELNWNIVGVCDTEKVGLIYNRSAVLTSDNNPPTAINININVSWPEPGATNYNVNQKSVFTVYE